MMSTLGRRNAAPNLLASPLMIGRAQGANCGENYSIPAIVDAARVPFSQASTIYKVGISFTAIGRMGLR